MELKETENEFYFIFDKEILKERLHIASCFHKNGTLWSCGSNYVELINNQAIKVRIIIPIISSNIPKGTIKKFPLPYSIKNNSLKIITVNKIVLYYSENKVKIIGLCEKEINFKYNPYQNSISSGIIESNDKYTDSDENEVNLNTLENIKQLTCTKFIDEYTIDLSLQNIYHTLDIKNYNNIIGVFNFNFHDIISFINKNNSFKCDKIKINFFQTEVKLETYNNSNFNEYNLITTFIKLNHKIVIPKFIIECKYFENIKGINIIMLTNKRKDKKIYNEILFELIKKNNEFGLILKPNNIRKNSEFVNPECFFIYLPIMEDIDIVDSD